MVWRVSVVRTKPNLGRRARERERGRPQRSIVLPRTRTRCLCFLYFYTHAHDDLKRCPLQSTDHDHRVQGARWHTYTAWVGARQRTHVVFSPRHAPRPGARSRAGPGATQGPGGAPRSPVYRRGHAGRAVHPAPVGAGTPGVRWPLPVRSSHMCHVSPSMPEPAPKHSFLRARYPSLSRSVCHCFLPCRWRAICLSNNTSPDSGKPV